MKIKKSDIEKRNIEESEAGKSNIKKSESEKSNIEKSDVGEKDVRKSDIGKSNIEKKEILKKIFDKKLIIIGSIAGLFSGLLASGGGLIIVPMLVLIYKMSEKESRAETIFCIFPMVITSMIIYGKTQFVNWNIGILCGIGGALGGFIGSKLLNKINDKYLTIIFIIFTIYSAVMMLIK